MILNNYQEKKQHGTPDFPIAVYRMTSAFAQNRAKPLYALHWHKELEFVTARKGGAQVLVDNQTFCLREGESVFINSNSIHAIFPCIEDAQVEVFSIVFHPSLLAADYSDIIYSKYVQPVLTKKTILPVFLGTQQAWSAEITQKLWQIISQFLLYKKVTHSSSESTSYIELSYDNLNDTSSTPAKNGSEIRIKCLLLDVWLACFEHSSPQEEKTPGISGYYCDCVKEAISFINTHCDTDISLEQLAELTHMSRENFSRVFKKYTGYAPFYYINRVRIYRSLEYLSSDEKNMTEIASLCGYQNVSYFNRKFKELMNCSPSAYKKRAASNTPLLAGSGS